MRSVIAYTLLFLCVSALHAADTEALQKYRNLSSKSTILTQANPYRTSPSGQPDNRSKSNIPPSSRAEVPANSDPVFGSRLFTGEFSKQSFSSFNPNHTIGIGDQVTLKLWGAQVLDTVITVDAQGNIFIPRVGPIKVVGVQNSELDTIVKESLRKTYRANVHSYVNLAAAQPVKIYVTGFVERPGMYEGLSSDSILNFLDQAGGVDSERGSYIDIAVKREDNVQTTVNLYNFLLAGYIPSIQFLDGDTIVVGSRKSTVKVSGLVQNERRFEFLGKQVPLPRILNIAKVKPSATHVRVIRNSGLTRNVDYYPIRDAKNLILKNGDDVLVTSDKKPGTITVRVEGEHNSAQEYILPYGSKLGELLKRVQLNAQSDINSVQLFRKSVKRRQKEMLAASLRSLQASVLTARSATNEEASLRNQEANMALKWIERAKNIEPRGQVILSGSTHTDDLTLQNGDIVNIPSKNSLVMVHGEVLFPTAVVFRDKATLDDYIKQAGGYTQSANTSRVVVLHPDGSFERAKSRPWSKKLSANVTEGDEILVLPKVDFKRLQITKDVSQVLYQIALSAAVVLAL